ncbi:MAG: hypothetical protein P4L46_01175 [Fimbriimonas sp.]|nr:hypothetical protein [Fimbriimonas sp.]
MSKVGIILLLSLVAAVASSQVVSDPFKVPSLQQPVNLHLKRALLPELTDALHKQTGVRFSMSKEIEPLMVCVFVDKVPLGLVMHEVADVLGCEWHDLRSEWRLVVNPKAKSKLAAYEIAERHALEQDDLEKAHALADYVRTHSFRQQSVDASSAPEPDNETPAQWAERVIADEAYYVAGIMFRDTPVIAWKGTATSVSQPIRPTNLYSTGWPTAFRLIAPPNVEIASWFDCGAGGELAVNLGDAHTVVRFLPWAGTLEAVLVDASAHRAVKPKYLVKYPRPVQSLAKEIGGKWLLEWETDLGTDKSSALDEPVENMEMKPSGFNKGLRGIEEYLEALFDKTKQPIISDAFRMPTIGTPPPLKSSTIRNWLSQTRESQKCFVRVDNGCVLVRHGGFWDLRSYEPNEERVRAFEKLAAPDLNDYADFALASAQDLVGLIIQQAVPFFDTQEIPLTRFDSKPLRDNLYPLLAYGQMSTANRLAVLSGGYFDTINHVFGDEETRWESQLLRGKDGKGRPKTVTQFSLTRPVEIGSTVQDIYLGTSASLGIFYGGTPTGKERDMLEDFDFPSMYLGLWNRSPDQDPAFVANFGRTNDIHAHYLFLRSALNLPPGITKMPDKTLYGHFEFLAGISDKDGVINVVDIPFPK